MSVLGKLYSVGDQCKMIFVESFSIYWSHIDRGHQAILPGSQDSQEYVIVFFSPSPGAETYNPLSEKVLNILKSSWSNVLKWSIQILKTLSFWIWWDMNWLFKNSTHSAYKNNIVFTASHYPTCTWILTVKRGYYSSTQEKSETFFVDNFKIFRNYWQNCLSFSSYLGHEKTIT